VKRAAPPTGQQTVLVTAFEPFGGRATNRSQLVLEHIARAAASPKGVREGVRVVTRTLPVSFSRLGRAMDRSLTCKPDVVILMGESAPAEQLELERAAVNRVRASIPDNDGEQPIDLPVVPGGPDAYFSTVKPKGALASVRKAGAAGAFACNAAYYHALHRMHASGRSHVPVIFVHVPTRGRALALRDATKGVLALLRHLAEEVAPRPQGTRRRTAAGGLRATRKA